MQSGLWRIFEEVAQTRGDAPAIIQGPRQLTFANLRQNALRVAAQLVRHGFQPGERCVLLSANSPELAAAILGVWAADGIVALVHDEAPVSHLKHAAEVTQASLVLADARCAEIASAALEAPVHLIDELAAEPMGRRRSAMHDHQPASIFFTSGSTGLPKGVTQSHANLAAGCRMVAHHLGLRQDDRILCPIPWSFDYGYGQFLSTVLLGVTQVLPEQRSPFALCEAIETFKPTILASLPSIFGLLIRGISPIGQTDVSSLRLITNTGGAIPPAIFADVLKIFSNSQISLNYGMTETYRSAGLPLHMAAERPESVGFAYPGAAISVIREDGSETDPGEMGEIVHRGVGVFMGYWGAPEATARVRRPDPRWNYGGLEAPMAMFTGDLGWRDEDGFLMIKGRRDRLIKSMGVRVSPDEVEAMLRGTGVVRDAVVVGVPHELMGEKVVAVVIAPEGAEDPLPTLKAFARREMSQHMQPREYRLLEQLPLTPNGKTDFQAIKRMFETPSRAPAPAAAAGQAR